MQLNEQFDPQDPLIQQNKSKVQKLLFDANVELYFVPSPYLQQVIAKGEHPNIQGLTQWIKEAFLVGNGIIIQKRIVWDLINNRLDKKNAFVFSNGDIRVRWLSKDITGADGIKVEHKSLKNDIVKGQ